MPYRCVKIGLNQQTSVNILYNISQLKSNAISSVKEDRKPNIWREDDIAVRSGAWSAVGQILLAAQIAASAASAVLGATTTSCATPEPAAA